MIMDFVSILINPMFAAIKYQTNPNEKTFTSRCGYAVVFLQ